MTTTTLTIQGMTCQHCVKAVKTALAQVTGVKRVLDVDLETGRAQVEGTAKAPDLIHAVKEEGYEASVAP